MFADRFRGKKPFNFYGLASVDDEFCVIRRRTDADRRRYSISPTTLFNFLIFLTLYDANQIIGRRSRLKIEFFFPLNPDQKPA